MERERWMKFPRPRTKTRVACVSSSFVAEMEPNGSKDMTSSLWKWKTFQINNKQKKIKNDSECVVALTFSPFHQSGGLSLSQTNVAKRIGKIEKWPFLTLTCIMPVIICQMKALCARSNIPFVVCVKCVVSSIASPPRPFGDSSSKKLNVQGNYWHSFLLNYNVIALRPALTEKWFRFLLQ